jgi:hypothetical protein
MLLILFLSSETVKVLGIEVAWKAQEKQYSDTIRYGRLDFTMVTGGLALCQWHQLHA